MELVKLLGALQSTSNGASREAPYGSIMKLFRHLDTLETRASAGTENRFRFSEVMLQSTVILRLIWFNCSPRACLVQHQNALIMRDSVFKVVFLNTGKHESLRNTLS